MGLQMACAALPVWPAHQSSLWEKQSVWGPIAA